MHRTVYLGLGTVAVAILTAGCGSTSNGSSGAGSSTTSQPVASYRQGAPPKPGYTNGLASLPGGATTLSGAGSTFVAPMMSVWTKQYAAERGVQVAYQSIGSGGGVAQIQAGTGDSATPTPT